MFRITGLVLLQFFFLADGELHYCQLTSTGNIVNDSNTAVVDFHQRLIINCSATQNSGNNLTFKWLKDEERVQSRVPFMLNITDVKAKIAGRFKCYIKQNNNLKESCNLTVIVKSPPYVKIEPTFSPLPGKRMILKCFVMTYFKPNTITWYKNGQKIFQQKDIVNRDGFHFQSPLTRSPFNLSDSGNYSCVATNIYGTARKNIFLSKAEIRKYLPRKVCPELRSKLKQENVTIVPGGTASLLCEVDHDKSRNPLYFRFDVITNNGSRPIGKNKNIVHKTSKGIEKTLLNYTIVNATKNDSGGYRCLYLHPDKGHCPQSISKIFYVKVVARLPETKKKHINLLMVVAVSVAGTLCGLALIIYVCHLRRKLKAQLYDTCPDNSPELRWDVFVSYSSHDFEWVNKLCEVLERPPFNLTVCLHQRDWELGRSLVDNMVDSVYGSHKTLIIVSEHYLQSEFCMQELQIAMHSEMTGEQLQRERIVLIKIDDVPMQRLPRFVRQKSFLDCSNPEHERHLQSNLLRVLPRRELIEEERFEDEEQDFEESNDSCSSSEVRLQELQVV